MSDTPRGFRALIAAQFFEAVNDNAFKTLLSLWVVGQALHPRGGARDLALASALFSAPFLLFSAFAGALADRVSKRTVALACKAVEIAVMVFGTAALAWGHKPFLFILLFLMGLHSAFFAPAKYGLLPEILEDSRLSWGNGLLQFFTFLAILSGTVLGGFLMDATKPQVFRAGFVFIAIAALGLGSSFFIPPVPAAGTKVPWPRDPVTALWRDLREAAKDRVLFLCVMGVGWFWLVGTLLYSDLLIYGHNLMGLSGTRASLLLASLAVGIGAGSILAGKIAGDKVEMGLVPVGSLGMGFFTLLLARTSPSFTATVIVLFGAGVMGGFFAVPLNAVIQQRSPVDQRGRFTALANVVSFLGVLLASGVFWLMTDVAGLGPAGAAAATGLLTMAATGYILTILPSAFVRMFLLFFTNTAYRIDVRGRENFPLKGPALLVCNHVSYVDPLLLSAAVHRPIHFFTWRQMFEVRGARWFFRLMHSIPIAPADGPRKFAASMEEARQALREGHVVCIFAEGAITRVAQMLGFRKGAEVIVKDLDVPIIPVHLDRVWGSIFSFAGGEFFRKIPRRLPYPVTVSFGKALPPTAKVHQIRQAVQELGSEAFAERISEMLPLHRAFLRQAKTQWPQEAMADSSGLRLSYGKTVVASALLARKIMAACPEDGPVGVLLPPCVPGTLVNLALALAGRVTANLNYTLPKDIVDNIVMVAGVRRIITSRRMLEALKWEPDPRMVFLEDLGPPGMAPGLFLFFAFRLLPVALWERFFPGGKSRVEDLATLMFTSGSTGLPKGVMLTHANIQSNVQGVIEVYQLDRRDTLMGVLPLFHSFGYMATVWFPLLGGFRVVYHRSPLEAEAVQKLIVKEKATIGLITPTILQLWLKKFDRESVKSLRFILTGAEKLRVDLAKEVEEKLGVPVLEGYGCTELSPAACVSTLNVQDRHEFQEGHKPGKVGRPLPGVSVRIVDPTDFHPLPTGTPGLLLVKGPNVMKGYWGMPEKTAEVLRDGWYVTGDIASVDEEGFVQITDRLSRFSKIGGEMIPHILLEEKLHAVAEEPEARFIVAAVPDEKKGEALVVLHNNFQGDVDDLCRKLQAAGLPPLWLPDRRRYFKLDEWPTLGTGKVDMGRARKLALELVEKPA